ncbi:hydroxyacylglutathione hydrolase [Parvularcula dongshanensis]|uniref:Hydroxyacylglutathione hydrolase n=1 Tax=Parvularcula dongshanensis TaxID=1173995 RepID=A0A840I1R2_9PROT|nr:hydroxyacylglutathione hydrolase [Parvularcula dongshanensis]MBB4658285.1 hydroxyacylglutathione hydrolase [Parvularcula dongshanensis]
MPSPTSRRFSHGALTVHQIPCLKDNYAFLLRDEETGDVAVVDTPEAGPILALADDLGWRIGTILNTHWHADHTGGNEEIKAAHGARIVGPAAEGDRIPGRDEAVSEGNEVRVGNLRAAVIATPGHTRGHITYHFESVGVLFPGDTLFSLGCGRLFEGTPEEMWSSLSKIRALPDETVAYPAHEYTVSNAKFALGIDPGNAALRDRAAEAERQRAAGEPTLPVRLGAEKAQNPFLRADDPGLAVAVGLEGSPPAQVFAEARRRKDQA